MPRKGQIEDLGSRVFGRLTVLFRVPNKFQHHTRWKCQCECGKTCEVEAINLKARRQVSCGCWSKENSAERFTTHGMSQSQEYKCWSGIKKRCYQANSKSYPNYGGRGIVMSDAWHDNFEAFLTDMGRRPPGGTIERTDNNGPYSKENCRWATKKEQALNTRRNHYIEHLGERLTLGEWANRYGIDRLVLLKRLRRGWAIEKALTGALQNGPLAYLTMNGVTKTLDEWATFSGITKGCIRTRIAQCGWTVDRALTEPMHAPGWPKRRRRAS